MPAACRKVDNFLGAHRRSRRRVEHVAYDLMLLCDIEFAYFGRRLDGVRRAIQSEAMRFSQVSRDRPLLICLAVVISIANGYDFSARRYTDQEVAIESAYHDARAAEGSREGC